MRSLSATQWRRATALIASLLLAGPPASLAGAAPVAAISPACSTASLIGAIRTAESTRAVDTIRLRAGCRYALTTGSFVDVMGPNGFPPVKTQIAILGNGATITRAPTAPSFRFFQVNRGGALRLENMTLQGGRAGATSEAGDNGWSGGAVLVNGGTLDAVRVTFRANAAGRGTDAAGGTVDGGRGGNGGAIAAEGRATLRVTGSSFIGNSAGRGGSSSLASGAGGDGGHGGAVSINPTAASAQVAASTFASNAAGNGGSGSPAGGGGGRGGAIYSEGSLGVNGSRFIANRAGAAATAWPEGGGFGTGGAIKAWNAALTISNSTFTGNNAFQAGAIWTVFGDASLGAVTTVSGSTFSANTAASVGGAIVLTFGTLIVTNSTLTGNRAGSVAISPGGAIVNSQGIAHVTNSSVSGNTASGDGGGIQASGTTTLRNTVVADNTSTGSGSGFPANCGGPAGGGTVDGGGNLRWPLHDPSCVGGYGDPKLLPLADNGGPTQTMALGAGSAALDVGLDATCGAPAGEPGDGAGARDQRGVARPTGAHCDAGAFEYAPLAHLALSPSPSTVAARGSRTYAAKARSAAGEDLGDVTASTTFSIGPEGTCVANRCTASLPGDHVVTGTLGAQTGTATLHVTKLTQAITFAAIASRTQVQAPLTLRATASSGLQVSVMSRTPLVCRSSGPNGATVILLRAGTCALKATQAGNSLYSPAPSVTRSFVVR